MKGKDISSQGSAASQEPLAHARSAAFCPLNCGTVRCQGIKLPEIPVLMASPSASGKAWMDHQSGGIQALYQYNGYQIYTAPGLSGEYHASSVVVHLHGNAVWDPQAVHAELCSPVEGPYRVTSDNQLELSDGRYNLIGD